MTKIFFILFMSILFTMIACSSDHKNRITSIPEASGISYCKRSNTLIVANDEGSFYEITPNGETILKYKLGKYDLEGVVCGRKEIIFAVENGYLLRVNRKSLKVKKLKIVGNNIQFSKKSGIEGIAKVNNLYYLSIQSKKSKKDAKLIVVKINLNSAEIMNIINHKIIDSAGMEYYKGKLYIVSDKKDKLYIYDIKNNTITKKIKLDKFAQEGVTFDNKGNIYFADDNGAVFKYRQKELNIKLY